MKITIIGAGRIGGVLGRKWAKAGHAIRYGVRNPRKPEVLELAKSLVGNAAAFTIAEAMDFGEVVLFAIPGSATEETIGSVARALDGKIIIDAANKIGAPTMNSYTSFARHTPTAKVYRAFNSYGWDIFDTPTFLNGAVDLFYAGPNGEPRSKVEKLISDIGLNPMYLGGPDQVEVVDAVLKLWFTLASGEKWGGTSRSKC